ncbi:unnamed protein product [Rotaria sp. Silwood2]|nr:unnamed protein product [Rotaria sp. Silwood2]CAF2601191.1 unnamed protein product [Rotaria sp. Silwood2]CAF2827500.1 unnamed protein product [Rotaria sp. Silwood2]CAF2972173.1 unnamed protein product [Rotaria sp. Silwood2]CAF3928570.1 unnamed protein product [Rotaria sp. Silwood2]
MDLFATVSRLPFSVLGPHRSDTCTVDRLNYKYTVIILVIFSIIVSNKQFSSDHIACWVPGHFTRSYEVYSNNICWVSNTYYVATAETLPLDENKKKTRVVKYYQWTPFILLFQAVLFYLPRMLWRSLSAKSGINIVNLVDAALNYQTADRFEDRNKIMTYLTRSIDQYVYMRKRKHKRFDFIRRFLAFILCVPGRRMGSYLLILFFVTKILFIVNSVGQLFLLNVFLGHNFASYGLDLIRKILNGEELTESIYFPRVTMCEFAVRNIQNVHVHTVQCVLPINLFNEKAFLFIWFWLAFLTMCNTYDLLAWFVRSFGRVRYAYIKKRLELMQSDTHLRRTPAKEFIHRYLQHDGVLILRLLAYNSSDLVVTELIQQLWQFYKRVGSGGGTGGPASTTGSGVSSAVIPSSSRTGPGGGRQVSVRLFDTGGGIGAGRDDM